MPSDHFKTGHCALTYRPQPIMPWQRGNVKNQKSKIILGPPAYPNLGDGKLGFLSAAMLLSFSIRLIVIHQQKVNAVARRRVML